MLNKTLTLTNCLLRAFFRGPVTKPFILNVSSKTGVVITLIVMFLLKGTVHIDSLTVVTTTFLKTVLSVNFILVVSEGMDDVSVLIIDNIVVNCVYSTIARFIIAFTSSSSVMGLRG